MFQFLQIVVAASAVLAILYAIFRPHWTFILIVLMFPLEQLLQTYVGLFNAFRPLFNYFIGILAVVAISVRLSRHDQVFLGFRNPVTALTAGLYGLWTIGLLYTPAPASAHAVFAQALPYLILLLLFFPLLVLDIGEFRKALNGMLLLGTTVAILILINPSSGFSSGRLFLQMGAGDRYGNALATGELGALIALIAALAKPPGVGQLYTLLRIAAFIAGFGLAIRSGSRGQTLAVVSCGILFYPLARRLGNPKQFLINAIGLAVIIGGMYWAFTKFISHENRARWDTRQIVKDFDGRFEMISELFAVYVDSPGHWLFGLGPSAYAAVSGHEQRYVHNIPAEILCEHGIIGAALFVLLGLFTFKYGKRLWLMYRHDASMRATVAVLLAICAFHFILALKQGSMSYPAPFFWWLVLAKLSKREQVVLVLEVDEPHLVEDNPWPEKSWPAIAGGR